MRLDRVAQSPISVNLTLIEGLNLIHLRSRIISLIGQLNLKQNGRLVVSPPSRATNGREVIDKTIVYSLIAIKSFGLAIDSAERRLNTLQTS